MRAVYAVLAAAALGVAAALNPADCPAGNPNSIATALATGASSSWQCFTATFGQGTTTPTLNYQFNVTSALAGSDLQFMIYNYQRETSTPTSGDFTWNVADAPGQFPFYFTSPSENKYNTVVNGIADPRRYQTTWNSGSNDFYLQRARVAKGGVAVDNTVYAATGTLSSMCTGQYSFFTNSTTNTQATTSMSFLFYFRTINSVANPAMARMAPKASTATSWTSSNSATYQLTSVLTSSTPVNVSGFLLPGSTLQIPVGDTFATEKYMIKRFQVQVQASGPSGTRPTIVPYGSAYQTSLPTCFVQGNTSTWDAYLASHEYGFVAPSAAAGTGAQAYEETWNNQVNYVFTSSATCGGQAYITVNTPRISNTNGTVHARDKGLGGFSSSGFNWANQNPFWDITVTITSLVEYPEITDGGAVDPFTLTDYPYSSNADCQSGYECPLSQRPFPSGPPSDATRNTRVMNAPYRVFMVKMPAQWWNFSLPVASATDASATQAGQNLPATTSLTAGPPTFDVQPALPSMSQTWGPITTHPTPWATAGSATASGVEWAVVTNENGAGITSLLNLEYYSTTEQMPTMTFSLAPTTLTRPTTFFVRVKLAATCETPRIAVSGATGSITSYTGECASWTDCLVTSNHPSAARAPLSANKDASRFTYCGVGAVGGATDPGKLAPRTMCFECQSDVDCGPKQYCSLNDNGICKKSVAGWGSYICDPTSFANYGICKAKSSAVLGKMCRALSTSTTPPVFSTTIQATGPSGVATTATVTRGGGSSAYAPNGFCGEATFWNATGIQSQSFDATGQLVSQEGQLRKVLWQGACVQHVCQECFAGSLTDPNLNGGINTYSVVPGKMCLNGALVASRDSASFTAVDKEDDSEGEAIGIIFLVVVIILLLSVWAYMCGDARRHREKMDASRLSLVELLFCCGSCAATTPGSASKSPQSTFNPVSAMAAGPGAVARTEP